MTAARTDLELRQFPIPALAQNDVLVRVNVCTICRSDLHTWEGKRSSPIPVILGHEIVGEIAAIGTGVTRDAANQPLKIGDRVTWTLHSCCGTCIYCRQYHLPMKCSNLKKYGHDSCDEWPHLKGGFAEYCLIDAGTSILKLPSDLPMPLAATLNCAAATVAAGIDAAQVQPGDAVLIQGAGGLGCFAAAFARIAGARQVIATDVHNESLEFIKDFGATHIINASELSPSELSHRVRTLTQGYGVDSALELSGVPAVIKPGLESLRKGGRYIEIGCSFPNANVELDMSQILWNLLTIQGVHNYDFSHLRRATQMVCQSLSLFPYDKLISQTFSLQDINEALRHAAGNRGGRVAIAMDATF
jgi:alcohol dehydrogenase